MTTGDKLEVGQGSTSYGIIHATPEGIALLGKLGELRVLAELVKQAHGWTEEELIENLPESIPAPYWACMAD
jgi:hypothetical protein